MHEELQSTIGIQTLTFGAAWYKTGAIVMCDKIQRRELIDDLQVLKGVQKVNYVSVLRTNLVIAGAVQSQVQ